MKLVSKTIENKIIKVLQTHVVVRQIETASIGCDSVFRTSRRNKPSFGLEHFGISTEHILVGSHLARHIPRCADPRSLPAYVIRLNAEAAAQRPGCMPRSL